MFTGLLHHLPLLTMLFGLFYWIKRRVNAYVKRGSRVLWRSCIGARQRMVRNKKIEQVLVATLCDWLKTSKHLTDQSTRPLKPYVSGSYVFPALWTSIQVVFVGSDWTALNWKLLFDNPFSSGILFILSTSVENTGTCKMALNVFPLDCSS